jgi:hypothetical protein
VCRSPAVGESGKFMAVIALFYLIFVALSIKRN